MNVSRYFLLIAIVYLLVGMGLGEYMAGSDDTTLRPLHAHINLVGSTLMAIFAAIYKVYPAMAASSWQRCISGCTRLALSLFSPSFIWYSARR